MVDRERVLAKLDELAGYLRELAEVVPHDIAAYRDTATRRACERILQIAIEAVIDICSLFVVGLRLGVPAEENDLFEKLATAGVLSPDMVERLRLMKGFRNLIVHDYGRVDDERVFELATAHVGDFDAFAEEIREALRLQPD